MSILMYIQLAVKKLRDTYRTGRTKDVEFRREQLRNLLRLMDENEEEILEAVHKDLHKVGLFKLHYLIVDLGSLH